MNCIICDNQRPLTGSAGRLILLNERASENASSLISVAPAGIDISLSDSQRLKVRMPMVVILSIRDQSKPTELCGQVTINGGALVFIRDHSGMCMNILAMRNIRTLL